MGLPMAGHLLRHAGQLVVHTRTKARGEGLIAEGATWADTPADVAGRADVIFICVTDTPDVRAVVTGPGGIIESAREGMIIVDHSTISPAVTREMAGELAQRGAVLLDAPVSGGDVGAKNATLSIMVGGEEEAFSKVLPLLQRMGKTITHCGQIGAGQLTKLTNQILVTINNLAACEALVFAQANGLDPAKIIPALGAGAAGSWQWNNLAPRMAAGDFAAGFMIDLQLKDLRLVLESAQQAGLDQAGTKQVAELFSLAVNQGLGAEGTQSLYKIVQEQSKKQPLMQSELRPPTMPTP